MTLLDPMTLLNVWAVGAFVSAIALGFLNPSEKDRGGRWLVAAFWPVIAAAVIGLIVLSLPFWLGSRFRRLFDDPA